MGKVMGVASKELAGLAEGRAISAKVKELLANKFVSDLSPVAFELLFEKDSNKLPYKIKETLKGNGKNQTPNLARVFWAVEHGSNHENGTKHSPVQLDFFNMS